MSDTIQMPINSIDRQRFVYFYLQNGSNVPVTNQGGNQPQLSWNSGVFENTGIGTLNHLGSGNYSALLANFQSRGYQVGDTLRTRYSANGVIETQGTTVQVVKPFISSARNAAETGVMFINSNSGQLYRRNTYYMGGRVHN